MNDPYIHALRVRLEAVMPIFGGSVVEVAPHVQRGPFGPTIYKRLLGRSIPAHMDPMTVRFAGWGMGLEATEMVRNVGVDRALDPDAAADQAIESMAQVMGDQLTLHTIATAVGIEAPLKGYGLEMLDHLIIDSDVVPALVTSLGSLAAVRRYISEQMSLRRQQAESNTEIFSGLQVHIVGRVLHVPFDLDAMAPVRQSDQERMLWTDGTLSIKATMPETVMAAAAGRRVEDLVQGTPIGHRLIKEVRGTYPPFSAAPTGVTIEMETPRAWLEEAIA